MSRLVIYHDQVDLVEGGVADVTDWDCSYLGEHRLRLTLDDMFVVEIDLPEDFLLAHIITAPIKVVESELGKNLGVYHGKTIRLDSFDCDFIRELYLENYVV